MDQSFADGVYSLMMFGHYDLSLASPKH